MSSRKLYVFGDICPEMAEQFIYDLHDLSRSKPEEEIEINICTEGGCVYSMFAMHDAMRSVTCPIRTFGIGQVMSAGVLLLSAGDYRLIYPHTCVMIHEPISESMELGSTSLRQQIEYFEKQKNQMFKLYAEYSGQDLKKIESDLYKEDGLYLTAEEALKYGFVDEICELRKRKVKRKSSRKR